MWSVCSGAGLTIMEVYEVNDRKKEKKNTINSTK